MPNRVWIAGIALGLAISGSPLCVQAQVGEGDEQRQTAPERNPSEDSRWTFPIEIVEDEAQAEARQRREERAEQREIDNLIAQRSTDEATQRMAETSVIQTWIIGIGTLLLFFTLWLTLQANRAAVRAAKAAEGSVEVTRDTARRQLRAYVGIENSSITNLAANDKPRATIIIRNFGQTPAHQLTYCIQMRLMSQLGGVFALSGPVAGYQVVDPRGGFTIYLAAREVLSDNQYKQLSAGADRIYVFGQITFTDIFKENHTTTFRLWCAGEQLLAAGRFAIAEDGNEAK